MPPFAYMTTYVKLLVRYADFMKMEVAERFFLIFEIVLEKFFTFH